MSMMLMLLCLGWSVALGAPASAPSAAAVPRQSKVEPAAPASAPSDAGVPRHSAVASAAPSSAASEQIAKEILAQGEAYENLAELVKIGPRMAGSPGAAKALAWAKAKMESYGFRNVSFLPMTAPVWHRGKVETAVLQSTAQQVPLAVTALGGSVSTPKGGVTAEVVRVKGLDDVKRLGNAVRGHIVFYDRPMDPAQPDAFEAYSKAVDQRVAGASQAARYGAVAVVVRSVGSLPDDDHPHTGAVHYKPDAGKIPAAALSTHAANTLAAALAQNRSVKLHLELSGQVEPPVASFNVMGELQGSDKPSEVVLLAAHIDSWDLGVGAQDDGAGMVEAIEALRAIKALGVKPRRTIRVVLFMSEETGGQGAEDYAKVVAKSGHKHLAAIESDGGGGAPVAISVDAASSQVAALTKLVQTVPVLAHLAVHQGYSGTDVEPLKDGGTLTIELVPDGTHYFDYHHSALDQLASIQKPELLKSAAAMAALALSLANETP